MKSDPERKTEAVDPVKDEGQAALVAALPKKFQQLKLERLFSRIYRYMNESERYETDDLVDGAEKFFLAAVDDTRDPNTPGDPFVDSPSTLSVVSVLAASAVTRHEKLEDTPPTRLKLFQQISDLYADTLMHQYDAHDYLNNVDLAELIYQKDSVHPGRTCTGIVSGFDELPEGTYIEIPLVAASQKCIVREEGGTLGGGFDPGQNQATGDLKSKIIDNNVYVPSQDLYRRLNNHIDEGGFERLYQAHTEFVSDANMRKFLEHESRITARIDRFLNAGQRDLIWTSWNPDSRLVRVLRSAVNAQDDLDPSDAYPAKVLYEAVERYQPNQDWEKQVIAGIKSKRSLANRLASLDTDEIEILETRKRVGNLYRVGYSGSHSRPIEFSDKEDLFELPCLQNIDARLKETSPTRKDLYNIVRMLRWLPGYRPEDKGREEFVEEVKELLQRYPWYDEQTSDYQIRFELDRSNDDDDPYLPMNCTNPDMERYCIGREECPYSIYGSLPFPNSMYEQIDDSGPHPEH